MTRDYSDPLFVLIAVDFADVDDLREALFDEVEFFEFIFDGLVLDEVAVDFYLQQVFRGEAFFRCVEAGVFGDAFDELDHLFAA